jgi:hypothetical protein
MHVNITKSETGNNKGSSSALVSYLEKENKLSERPEYWFNQERSDIRPYEVRSSIDANVAKLAKDDAKFFLINISPSAKELLYLKEQYGEAGIERYLKDYANSVMDAYAKNFKRDGVAGNSDLVYFGKLEHYRYYAYKDLEVRKGLAKKGDRKPGEQMHLQIIVSRKDKSNSIKLSPLNNSKGKNAAHSQKVGQFDRVAFKQQSESLFDGMFNYDREIKESFKYANTQKHGSYEEKQEIKQQQLSQQANRYQQQEGHYHGKGLLDILLDGEQPYVAPLVPDARRRKKKRRGPDHNQGYRM